MTKTNPCKRCGRKPHFVTTTANESWYECFCGHRSKYVFDGHVRSAEPKAAEMWNKANPVEAST